MVIGEPGDRVPELVSKSLGAGRWVHALPLTRAAAGASAELSARVDVRGGRVYSPLSVARQRCAPAGPPREPSAPSLLRRRFRHKWNSCFCASLAVCSVFGKNIFNRPRRHLQSLET